MYSVQLLTEITKGRHNIAEWVKEEVSQISEDDLNLVRNRAISFLKTQHEELESHARITEILYHFDSIECAGEAITQAVLQTIIMIKPEFLVRGGREVAFPGVAPIQAIATQIGLHLHHDQIDAVQTGLEILADFQDIGIYNLMFGKDENHHDTCVVQSNFSDVDNLQSKIKATMYLPPMLVAPKEIVR